MESENIEVLIIGAGLSGLTLGYLLSKAGVSFRIVEARDRIGGRILTLGAKDKAPLEMGATWLGTKHKSLISLLDELELPTFKQELGHKAIYEPMSINPHQIVELPANNDPSYRIVGGTSTLINKLFHEIDANNIYLNEAVKKITLKSEELLISTSNKTITAKKVVSTIPPYLFYQNVITEPKLTDDILNVLASTYTWMGDSIKVALSFDHPFWRTQNLSGTIFSNVGPIPEMYDHSNSEDSQFALKGFLNGNYFSYSKEQRLELILNQLRKYYGSKIDSYKKYAETVWRLEKYTFTPYEEHILPHQNNGHQLYQDSYLNNSLFFSGAETATMFPGYMDGAVSSAQYLANQIVVGS